MTTSTNLDFTFDAFDKRFDQISFKLVTVNDRLIYARMANEFKLFKDKPGGYTPTMITLAVTGGFSDRKPVMKTFQRLKAAGLLVQHETKPRQPLRFTVLSIDEALRANPQLLSMPTMAERRANGLQLEKKGRKNRSVVPETTANSDEDSVSVVPEPLDCSSRDHSTVVPETTDCSFRDTHERTIKERERSLKEGEKEDQGHVDIKALTASRDDDSLSPKAHISEDEFDQIMTTEDEEAKPVVTKVTPIHNYDDEPLDEDDFDDEDDHSRYHDEDAAEKARDFRESLYLGNRCITPTAKQKERAKYNRSQSYRNSPNY